MTPEHKFTMNANLELGTIYGLLNELAGKVDALIDGNEKHDETRELLLAHVRGEEAVMAQFKSAFPAGDPVGHCNWHEAEIERIRARKDFWTKMTFELAKWGLIGFLGWVVLQMWHGALQGPAK